MVRSKGVPYSSHLKNMPELPEVETVRRQLEKKVLHKPILKVEVLNDRILQSEQEELVESLEGSSIKEIGRIGKLLEFSMSNTSILLAHLKMTGQFLYKEAHEIQAGIFPLLYASAPGGIKYAGTFKEQPSKDFDRHTHVIISFEDGSQLGFRDVRKFGYLKLVSLEELKRVEETYGIDPLRKNFTREAFHQVFERRQKSLKAVLLDQRLIAGIGNIYADEICHQTKLRPDASASQLKAEQIDRLYNACTEIIQRAVEHKGTTLRDFKTPDGGTGEFAFELKAYGRNGFDCLQCKSGIIKKIVHHGRGTHFCDSCQS